MKLLEIICACAVLLGNRNKLLKKYRKDWTYK